MITGVLNHSLTRAVCWYLCLFLVCVQMVPSTANASFISTVPQVTDDPTNSNSEFLQADLERKLLSERLAAMGLSSEEISVRVESLSDGECHVIASDLGKLQMGEGNSEAPNLLLAIVILALAISLIGCEAVVQGFAQTPF